MDDSSVDNRSNSTLVNEFSTTSAESTEKEFWATWNLNNEQNSKKRTEEESKTEEEDVVQAQKRKQEVLSVLNGYRNDIKKKKKQKQQMAENDDGSLGADNGVNEMKRKRMEAFEPVIAAFNVGDFEQMAEALKDKCDENMVFSSQLLSQDSIGLKPLLLFWGLLHEMYPDAMIQILETRLSCVTRSSFHFANRAATVCDSEGNVVQYDSGCTASSSSSSSTKNEVANSCSNENSNTSNSNTKNNNSDEAVVNEEINPYADLTGSYHSVEYVYKFTGTRITDRPVSQTFNKLIQSVVLADDITQITNESLTNVISKYMTSADVPLTTYSAHGCSYIIETILTFNKQNKIIKWSYGILAEEVN